MSPETGIPILLTLGALWILYRMERRPDRLPPPDRSVTNNFKYYIARWTRAHGEMHGNE